VSTLTQIDKAWKLYTHRTQYLAVVPAAVNPDPYSHGCTKLDQYSKGLLLSGGSPYTVYITVLKAESCRPRRSKAAIDSRLWPLPSLFFQIQHVTNASRQQTFALQHLCGAAFLVTIVLRLSDDASDCGLIAPLAQPSIMGWSVIIFHFFLALTRD
jgi:hypothetical protein